MQFRVLAGKHIQDDPDGKERTYRRGDVVETKIDLVARFANKFERLDGPPPPDPYEVEAAEAQLRAKALEIAPGYWVRPDGTAVSGDGFVQPTLESWSRSENVKRYWQALILHAQGRVNKITAALRGDTFAYRPEGDWNESVLGKPPADGKAALAVLDTVIANARQALAQL